MLLYKNEFFLKSFFELEKNFEFKLRLRKILVSKFGGILLKKFIKWNARRNFFNFYEFFFDFWKIFDKYFCNRENFYKKFWNSIKSDWILLCLSKKSASLWFYWENKNLNVFLNLFWSVWCGKSEKSCGQRATFWSHSFDFSKKRSIRDKKRKMYLCSLIFLFAGFLPFNFGQTPTPGCLKIGSSNFLLQKPIYPEIFLPTGIVAKNLRFIYQKFFI